jgi:hypothetical protein
MTILLCLRDTMTILLCLRDTMTILLYLRERERERGLYFHICERLRERQRTQMFTSIPLRHSYCVSSYGLSQLSAPSPSFVSDTARLSWASQPFISALPLSVLASGHPTQGPSEGRELPRPPASRLFSWTLLRLTLDISPTRAGDERCSQLPPRRRHIADASGRDTRGMYGYVCLAGRTIFVRLFVCWLL